MSGLSSQNKLSATRGSSKARSISNRDRALGTVSGDVQHAKDGQHLLTCHGTARTSMPTSKQILEIDKQDGSEFECTCTS
jgi:hypothetical protein